ncbi:MAG TPA: lipoate--protein ligase family protein [Bacillota bacterium]
MQEQWGFLDSGCLDAAVNMALDESLLKWHSEGKIPPTLRFYGWKKPSLSVGRFQNVEQMIDFDGIKRHKCQFVKRLTGGSGVLHDDELTYSIVISEQRSYIPKSIRKAYYHLSKGLLEGYKNLGIQASYTAPKDKERDKQSAVCFEKPAFYELVYNEKKLSGNAQTRKKGVLLQHGSIPITINEQMLFDLFRFPTEEVRERKRRNFKHKAITIEQITQKQHTFGDIKSAFYKGFQTGLNIALKPIELSPNQWKEVYDLADKKYKTEVLS